MGDSVAQHDTGSIENEFYKVTFNMWTGEITSLRDKATQWESLAARQRRRARA
jgi:hypothetical protein